MRAFFCCRSPFGACCTLAALLLSGTCAVGFTAKAAEPELYRTDADDPAMRDAELKARETFAGFLAKFAAPPPGTHDYTVKIDLSGGRGTSEIVWLKPFILRDNDIVGAIDNTPEIRTEFKRGQVIALDRDDVVDWSYRDGDARKGNFTGCALLAHEAPPERDDAARRLHLDCAFLGRAAR